MTERDIIDDKPQDIDMWDDDVDFDSFDDTFSNQIDFDVKEKKKESMTGNVDLDSDEHGEGDEDDNSKSSYEIDKLKREAEEARKEAAVAKLAYETERKNAFEAKKRELENALNNAETNARYLDGEINDLEYQIEDERAKGEDSNHARIADLRKKLLDKKTVRDNIKGEINKYTPIYQNMRYEDSPALEAKKESNNDSVSKAWIAENSHWWNDPAFKNKRDKAESEFNRLVKSGYNPNTMAFWKAIDKVVEDSNSKQRRSAPITRGTTFNNGEKAVVKQKADAQVLALTNKILTQRGYDLNSNDINTPEFKRKRELIYKSVQRQLAGNRG